MLRPFFVLVLLGSPTLAYAASDPAQPSLHTLTYSGDQKLLAELDREIAAAGKDTAKLEAVEKRLFDALRRGDGTYAGRQAICQRLALVLGQTSLRSNAEAYRPLGTMLADERESDLARLALEPASGAVVDTLFVTALEKTSGAARIGIIGSLGRRRVASATSALAKLLQNSDVKTGAAAARALGEIGTSAAVVALRSAPPAIAADALAARIAATKRLPNTEAASLLREIQADTNAPAHLRAAALRSSLGVQPDQAANRIAQVLAGKEQAFKQVALEAIADVSTSGLVPALAGKLNSWDPATQAAVITAFARRGDAAATPAIFASVTHTDAEVRRAALAALGFLPGNREIATALARAMAGDDPDDARIARQSLARLNGPDVSTTILAGAERGDPKLRGAYLEQLALRNMTEALPLLHKSRGDADASVRMAAVAALGEIAPPSELGKLLDWTVGATDEAEQSRALRSVVSVTLRNGAPDTRGQPLYAAIEKADPDVAQRLLPALSRIGGKASAESAARLAVRNNPNLAEAAVATLTRWTDHTAMGPLATVATKAEIPTVRAAALDGVLKSFDRYREPWTAESTKLVAGLLDSTKDAAVRKQLLKLLNRAKDPAALELAQSNKNDPQLGSVAAYAAAVIEANRAGPAVAKASHNTANARNMLDGKTSTRWNTSTQGEEWIEIDFKVTRPIQRITLDQTGRVADFPEHYEVYVANDLHQLGSPQKSGQGQRMRTVVELPPNTSGRYLVIKNTKERPDGQWAVCELFVE